MYNRTRINAAGRFMLLMLAFACGAVIVYSLRTLTAPLRYVLTPAAAGQVSLLQAYFSDTGMVRAEAMLRAASGIAPETALWLIIGMTACAGPLFFAASALRGACFGFVLSLIAGDTVSVLTGPYLLPFIGWLAVTVLLMGYASVTAEKTPTRCFLQFLPSAGAAFWITFLCSTVLPSIL